MQQDLSEVYFYLKGTLKYKRVAILFALAVCIGAWTYIFLMPDRFESKAKVHIDSATVIRPLMRGMVIEPDISALIRIIQQLMFTRPNLEKIIELSQLSRIQDEFGGKSDLIERLKKDITIAGGRGDIFDIAFSARDPEVARSVVQAVLTVFSEQTEGKALADASDAQRFIEQQIRDYEIRLQDAEKAKEEFKRTNMDLLNDADQFQALQKMKEQYQDANTALQQAISRRDVLAEQVAEVRDSDEDWGIPTASQEVSSSADNARIESLKDKRTELLLKYTEKHPSIIEIDKLIDTLKSQEQQELASKQELANKENKVEDQTSIAPAKMTNPYVQALKMGFDNAQAEVASNEALVESIRKRIAKLEEGLNERLTIETEMKNLNRDYETISGKYSELLERREQAHITERVDDQTSRLKFKIADPPSKPDKPSFPNRKLFYSLVLLVSIVIGFCVAFLIYFIRPVFMSARQVRVVTGLPSLGSVSLTSQGINKTTNIDWILVSTLLLLVAGYIGIMALEILK
ncbi:exosortase [Methylomonas koyamae]|uniref:Exosortase n=1 Tax=Methylomonas koyamae TaxID=702114 RepID=A0A177NQ92_9GAMM|nr:XrtA system polysaccharide chain length determinant [Methylomonas koyamae]OAI20061.1 exosortase [Methylomonas koyamae]